MIAKRMNLNSEVNKRKRPGNVKEVVLDQGVKLCINLNQKCNNESQNDLYSEVIPLSY